MVHIVDKTLTDRIRISTFNLDISLEVDDAKVSDSGTYTCVVEYGTYPTEESDPFPVDVVYGSYDHLWIFP
jgi:hypothetical protein